MTEPVVKISLKEIYEKLVDLSAKMDAFIRSESATVTRIDDHEDRIRSLERGRWPLHSIAVLVSILAVVLAFMRN